MVKNKKAASRVYFIGAGLSAGLHYPTGRELMRSLVRYLQNKPQDEYLMKKGFSNSVWSIKKNHKRARQILKVIESVLQTYFASELKDIGRIDVTEFFTMASTLSESPWLIGKRALETRSSIEIELNDEIPSELTLFADLAAITRTYFNDIGFKVDPPPQDFYALLEMIRPESDSIINFNWDEEVDIGLTNGYSDVSYTLKSWYESNEILVLKPHGSIGWYDVKQGIGNEDAYFIAENDSRLARVNKRILAFCENELPKDIDRKTEHSFMACPPVITAPTFSKRFEYAEQHLIWQDILKVCSEAQEFVFLGYSMPNDDFLTRASIRRSIQSNNDRKNMKCLVIDQSFDEKKSFNFQSVFKEFSPDRNYFRWKFGCQDNSLSEKLEDKLSKASLFKKSR